MRINGLGGSFPVVSGNAFTNMYAMMNSIAITTGKITSEKITARHLARGTSPESFSDGRPSFFFLYPVIIVRVSRQYPIQELLCERELPRDIHRKNSLKEKRIRDRSERANMNIPIVNDEVGKYELVRVEQERSDAKCENRDPEVDEIGCPPRHCDVKKHDQCSHPEVYAWASETRKEDTEG